MYHHQRTENFSENFSEGLKAPKNFRKGGVLGAFVIKNVCPALNEQLDNDILTLFRNDFTYI